LKTTGIQLDLKSGGKQTTGICWMRDTLLPHNSKDSSRPLQGWRVEQE
jgi:hypothetical protein